jgi:hypothetical protein
LATKRIDKGIILKHSAIKAEREMHRKTILALLGLVAVASLLFAQNEKIKIKNSSQTHDYPNLDLDSSRAVQYLPGDRVFLDADLGKDSVVLVCYVSHDDCVTLSPGDYEIARLIPGEGSYKSCPNVDIYRIGADRLKEKPLGEYCLRYQQY